MFTIGDFASFGRVSVRMLHHYDAIGLLTPAVVDPHTGYRYYHAGQLGRLNRIIALKELGFTLKQVQSIIDDKVDVAELHGMLRLRRAQLREQVAADEARLTGIAARLRMIEKEGHMNTSDVVLKKVPTVRVAELAATAAGYGPEHITPVIAPLYPDLMHRLQTAGITPVGPAIAYYEPTGEGEDAVVVHAGVPVHAVPGPASDDRNVPVVDLPAIPSAATLIHHGSMENVMESLQILAHWIDDNGYRPLGYHREVYIDYYPERADEGVTELQVAVTKS
jgi:DNA-binding transcriptional MerR regulator/effector-binding domain-containing protein